MVVGTLAERPPTAEAVRHDLRSGDQPARGAARDLTLAEAPDRSCAAAALSRARSAEIGVVHLHPPRKPRLPLAPGQFHRGDAVLRRHDQMDGREPECQRQLGRMEDRARRGRCLLLTAVALIEPPALQHAMPPMAAGRADETVRPAQPNQRRAALLLGAEGLAKRLVAQATHARRHRDPHIRDLPVWNI